MALLYVELRVVLRFYLPPFPPFLNFRSASLALPGGSVSCFCFCSCSCSCVIETFLECVCFVS